MSNNTKMDNEVKEHIKEGLKHLIFVKGKFNANTKEISEYTGIARTLINYYYRSKTVLFEMIYKEAIEQVINSLLVSLSLQLPFKEKVSYYINLSSMRLVKYPYLDIYAMTHANFDDFTEFKLIFSDPAILQVLEEIRVDFKKEQLAYSDPEHFFLDLISLTSYPFATIQFLNNSKLCKAKVLDQFVKERNNNIINILYRT